MRRRDFVALLGGTTTLAFGTTGNAPTARSHPASLLTEQFLRLGFVHVPSLISESDARSFEISTRSLPSRRVICGDPDISWAEQEIPEDHELHNVFSSQRVKRAAAALLNTNSSLRHLTCWVSRYRQGEYIGPHKDRAGTLQIVMSLNSTGEGTGGALNLLVEGERTALHLNPGDALFFRATSITHYTTPLIATARCPDPLRVVGVGRYFFSKNSGDSA